MRRFIFFMNVLFALWPAAALASNITLEYRIGWGDRFQLGKWTPVTIIIQNRGRIIKGILKLENTSGSEYRGDVYRTVYSMEVELPTNSKKRFSFTILLESFSHPLIIQLIEDGNRIETKSINLRPYYVETGLGVIVTDKISAIPLPSLPDELQPAVTLPQLLPESWYGYEGVDMLIMHAHILDALNERQYSALKEWIKNGGCIIISSGQHTTALLGKRILDLLPMTISGFERIKDLTGMEGFSGRPFDNQDPFLVLRAFITDGTVLMMEKNTPIITLKDWELGMIIFMAFDYQASVFRIWDGWKGFLGMLYMLTQDHAVKKPLPDIQSVTQGLVSAIPTRFPKITFSLVMGFMYLIVGIVFFKLIEKIRRIKIILCYAAIALFSCAVIWLFFLKSPQKPLTYNSFSYIKKGATNSVRVPIRQTVGFYALENTIQTLYGDVDHHPPVPLPVQKNEDGYILVHDIHVMELNSYPVVSFPMKKWSYCFLTTDSRILFPLQGNAVQEGDRLSLSWINETRHRIMECYVYVNRRLLRIGPIEPMSKGEIHIPISEIEKAGLFLTDMETTWMSEESGRSYSSLLDTMKKNISKDIITLLHVRYQSRSDILCLLGWIESDVPPFEFKGPAPSGEGVIMLEWEIRVETL